MARKSTDELKPKRSRKTKTTTVEKESSTKQIEEKKTEESSKEKKPLPSEKDVKEVKGRWKDTYHDEEKEENAKKAKEEEEKKPITPSQYFAMVKEQMQEETTESIQTIYNATYNCIKRYMVSNQKAAAKDCYARCQALIKEQKLIEKGVTKWVDRHIVDTFIDEVADKCVCIIELSQYPRPIPDEIIDKVMETSDIFDQFFILFTDYTGEEREKVAKEKRDKDPILFGNVFIDGKVSNKMYFIGDWVDEYCDLTMSQMIKKMSETYEGDILHEIAADSRSLEEIEAELYGRKLNKDSKVNSDIVNTSTVMTTI